MRAWKATSSSDERFMARAAALARLGRGSTAPNPCVGAVLVHAGEIAAEGWHMRCGGPHAERECLADARAKGVDPRGMTMYVTLEPCNHHGKTPPCTEAVAESGVAKVVVGTRDPNPVAAGGVEFLQERGVEVQVGVLERECRDLIADFLLWQRTELPFNIVKMAATLDGKIASRRRVPEPVSSPESFAKVHELRRTVGAVVVGGGTLRADDPSLACRLDDLPDDFVQPLAVVVTSRLPKDPNLPQMLCARPDQVVFLTAEDAARSPEADALRTLGASAWALSGKPGQLDLAPGFERLRTEKGCHYTLVEGGGRLAMQCVEQGLAHEIAHFVAPRILGDEQAPSAYSGRNDVTMAQAVDYRIIAMEPSGGDMMLTLRPA